MKAFKLLVPVALALCLVSCKKVENGYTAGNLEGSYWTGKVITDTDDINSTYECNLHLNAEGGRREPGHPGPQPG